MKLPINNIPVRFPKWVFSWVLLFFDSFMGFIVFYSVTEPRFTLSGDSSYNIELIYVTIQIFWCVLFYLNRLYLGEYTISRISELVRLVRIVGLVIGFYIISQSVGLIPELISPMIVMKYGFLLSFFTCCNRIFLRSIQKWLLEIGFGRENTVIVGANERGKKAVQFFRGHQAQGFNILGFIHFDGEPNDFVDGTKVLSHFNDIENIIQKENISDVVLALNDGQRSSSGDNPTWMLSMQSTLLSFSSVCMMTALPLISQYCFGNKPPNRSLFPAAGTMARILSPSPPGTGSPFPKVSSAP